MAAHISEMTWTTRASLFLGGFSYKTLRKVEEEGGGMDGQNSKISFKVEKAKHITNICRRSVHEKPLLTAECARVRCEQEVDEKRRGHASFLLIHLLSTPNTRDAACMEISSVTLHYFSWMCFLHLFPSFYSPPNRSPKPFSQPSESLYWVLAASLTFSTMASTCSRILVV